MVSARGGREFAGDNGLNTLHHREVRCASAAICLASALLTACAPSAPRGSGSGSDPAIVARVPAVFPADWRYPSGRAAPFAKQAMVVSANKLASDAGIEILRSGGNAIDAAVATGFALAVVHPEAGNLGGGGFMLIRLNDGRTAALDYREMAPMSASRDMFIGRDGRFNGGSLKGALASGVPGSVAGMTEALSKWGKRPLRTVIAPAIRLAEAGFIVDSALNASINSSDSLIRPFAGREVFLASGHAAAVGTVFKQPALAKTLRAIAANGAKGFYEGPVADEIVAEMKLDGGNITLDDLRRYKPMWRTPLRTTYRGYGLLMMPPVSSGGVTIGETFNIVEAAGDAGTFGSARSTHTLAAAYQRAFTDRNDKLGDPAFVRNPLEELLDKGYARRLAATIQPGRATPTSAIASPRGEENETTHYSVVDAEGNAVSTTTTLNELYGSGVYVRGAGFFLNDEMDDFTTQPGHPNLYKLIQGEANAIAPGKRMLSAMSPSIVFDPAGKVLLVLGGRGGPRIITSVSQVIRNVIDYRMSLSDALSAPRIHHQAQPDSIRYDRGGFPQAVLDSLSAMGYGLQPVNYIGAKVNAIMRVRGGLEGMWDPRGIGGVAAY
ncbi:MAG: gamma-glutamyltransferase [Gemmatimonadaceae bacterium]|nr:gamma-glutamyltransferase [Gemmatimonadaceae bacterium]